MSESRAEPADPKLLLEAARVFNAAGRDYKTIAEVVAELALEARDKADEPKVRGAIIGDAVALRLSGRISGGYQSALELVKEIREDDDWDGRLHLLRAFANGQKYTDRKKTKPTNDSELLGLRGQIFCDLEIAFSKNKLLRDANKRIWLPDLPAAAGDREDDLSEVYQDGPEFRILVDPLKFASTDNTKNIVTWLYSEGKVIDQAKYAKLQTWLNTQDEIFLKNQNYPPAAFVSGDTPASDLELIRRRAMADSTLNIPSS